MLVLIISFTEFVLDLVSVTQIPFIDITDAGINSLMKYLSNPTQQKAKILVIDDEPIVRMTIEGLLFQENLQLIFAENGEEGLQKASQTLPDAILLDLMMPEMDGYEVCRRIRANPDLAEVPIIMITAVDNREAKLTGLAAGADDFLTKPFDSLEMKIRIQNILRLNRFRTMIEQRDQLSQKNAELITAYDKTIEGWSRALDLRDKETEGHTQRVTEKSIKLARLAGIAEEQLIHIRRGALLHDIGKLGIPDSILLKPGPLTKDEWEKMKMHPVYAYEWLAQIDYLKPAVEIPYCHHEKWNGTGYPRKLSGQDIPVAARIFSIVDVWDALLSERPYRKSLSVADVRSYLQDHSGIDFDPEYTSIFLNNF
jgi:putative two-component system response regulator